MRDWIKCPSVSFVTLVPQIAVRCAWALGTVGADGAQHAGGGCRRAQVSAGILVHVHMKCMSPYSIHTISKRMDFPCVLKSNFPSPELAKD